MQVDLANRCGGQLGSPPTLVQLGTAAKSWCNAVPDIKPKLSWLHQSWRRTQSAPTGGGAALIHPHLDTNAQMHWALSANPRRGNVEGAYRFLLQHERSRP